MQAEAIYVHSYNALSNELEKINEEGCGEASQISLGIIVVMDNFLWFNFIFGF